MVPLNRPTLYARGIRSKIIGLVDKRSTRPRRGLLIFVKIALKIQGPSSHGLVIEKLIRTECKNERAIN